MDELVRDAVVLQQPAWPQIRFTVDLPAERPVPLACDGPKVSQALTNLLQNSINAVSEGSGGPVPAR